MSATNNYGAEFGSLCSAIVQSSTVLRGAWHYPFEYPGTIRALWILFGDMFMIYALISAWEYFAMGWWQSEVDRIWRSCIGNWCWSPQETWRDRLVRYWVPVYWGYLRPGTVCSNWHLVSILHITDSCWMLIAMHTNQLCVAGLWVCSYTWWWAECHHFTMTTDRSWYEIYVLSRLNTQVTSSPTFQRATSPC